VIDLYGSVTPEGGGRFNWQRLIFLRNMGMFPMVCVMGVRALADVARSFRTIALLFFLGFLSGCSLWDSFTSYFNTFYNAQRQFTEAEDELWNQPDTKYSGRNLLMDFTVPPNSKTKFVAVIEKCSKLLQYHPTSNLVDDALLLIGKAYFYQAEYQRAERKFRELMDQFPDGNYYRQSMLLLAFTSYKAGNKVQAEEQARLTIDRATKDGDDNIVGEASFMMGMLENDRKNLDAALKEFERAAEYAPSATRKATAYLNIGQIYNDLGDYARAEKAYRSANNAADNYVGEFRGRIGAVRMMAKQREYSDCTDELKDLRHNPGMKEFYAEIDFEQGNVWRDAGHLTDALQQYKLVDTSYVRSEMAANAVYQMGLVFETRMALYDTARILYSRGRNMGAKPPVSLELVRRSDYLSRYTMISKDLAKYDSIRTVLRISKDSTVVRKDSSVTDSTGKKITVQDTSKAQPAVPRAQMTADSADGLFAQAMSELATLFYTSMNNVDSALTWYTKLVVMFPENKGSARALFALAQIYDQDSTGRPGVADSLRKVIIDRFPDSEFADESRRLLGLPAVARAGDEGGRAYLLAEQSYLDGRYEEAVGGYRKVVEDTPASTFAPKAQYAVGWIYEYHLSNTDSAIANYQALVTQYPTSQFATRVRPMLIEVETNRKAVQDSLARQAQAAAAADSLKANAQTPLTASADSLKVPIPGPADTAKAKGQALFPAPVDSAKAKGQAPLPAPVDTAKAKSAAPAKTPPPAPADTGKGKAQIPPAGEPGKQNPPEGPGHE